MALRSFESRFRGGILGLATGDALGVAVEFCPREEIRRHPVKGMTGHGTHNQPPGTWSDDTSLTLCLLEGLSDGKGLAGIAELFHSWMTEGYWTATGTVFDVGQTTREALERIEEFDDPREAAINHEHANGNGSLMRTLPVALMNPEAGAEEVAQLAHDISHLTHGHPRSLMACGIYCDFVRRLMQNREVPEAWEETCDWAKSYYADLYPRELATYEAMLSRGAACWCTIPARHIESSGYVVHTLEAALWCFFTTANYKDCVLKAVNLGDDADTTGAVAGALAGVSYGIESIPEEWLEVLARREEIESLVERALKVTGAEV